MKKGRIGSLIMAATCCFTTLFTGQLSANAGAADIKYEYGVFLGADPENISDMESYRKIVIDAQYFSKDEISKLKNTGHIVYSYINLGSVEEFRSYFEKYKKYTLGVYENWEDERWVDVSQKEWQDFIVGDIAKGILDKGVDGLFVDNCDVYYNFKEDKIYDGVTEILKGFKKYGTYVMINGGDTYVTEYAKKNKSLDAVMDAVNQETVFSAINWENETFTKNKTSEREYFQEYCKLVSDYGKDVYLLEYTKDSKLIDSIKSYCLEKGYTYYASSTLDLLTPGQEKGSQPLIVKDPVTQPSSSATTATSTTVTTSAVTTSTVTTSAVTKVSQLLAGDANVDNIVDLSDVVLIMQSLANPDKYGLNGTEESRLTEQGAANADVEGSNGVTLNDALKIQEYLLKIIPTLSV